MESRSGITVYGRGCSNLLGTCNTITCTGSNSYTSSAYFCITDKCNGGNNVMTQIKLSTLVMVILFSLISYKILFL